MKKKNSGLVVLVIVLIVIILGLGGYIVYDKFLKDSSNVNESSNNKKVSTIKLDDDLDYVYDADYSYNNKYTEFDRLFAGEESGKRTIDYYGIDVEYNMGKQILSDLKVPFINIKSADADNVNQKIKNLYIEEAKKFDNCAEEANKGVESGPSCSQILTYRTYIYEDILSVIVIDSTQSTGHWILNYNIFNFDLNSGDLINFDKMLSKVDYNKENTFNKLKDQIKNKMDELYGSKFDLNNACSNNSNCYDKAYEILDNDIKNNSLKYFIDNNGKLNVLVIPYCDIVENGNVNHYLVIVEK